MSQPEEIIPFDELPEGFARSVAHPPEVPVRPRPAATIVLMRDAAVSGADGIEDDVRTATGEGPGAAAGIEVLLLRRSRRAGFVPGAYVFPGGRVDRSDATDSLMERVDGLTPDFAAQRLGLADPAEAMAYYLAALREAFEETGILVAHRPDGSPPPTAAEDAGVEELRNAVLEDRLTFAQALDALECRIDGEAVAYVAHWITPEAEPRRYDTRFFAAHAPPGAQAVIDPREMTDAVWLTPNEALRRREAGALPLVFPTIKTLKQLAAYPSVESALKDLGARSVPAILPRLVITPDGVGTVVDG